MMLSHYASPVCLFSAHVLKPLHQFCLCTPSCLSVSSVLVFLPNAVVESGRHANPAQVRHQKTRCQSAHGEERVDGSSDSSPQDQDVYQCLWNIIIIIIY